jgi:hypothetical protein
LEGLVKSIEAKLSLEMAALQEKNLEVKAESTKMENKSPAKRIEVEAEEEDVDPFAGKLFV